ncbi:hypothetical protein I7I51_08821 [Histoplasma capsulatum]|uniref:Uncharacterized protein n=1 Tax=Ajellomyces capsulatus TaxID=5037 RepID=A0A8A1LYW6_AJECA|nr:hypothetical protein I7I51_08821 [Histoplasma capsulatum]
MNCKWPTFWCHPVFEDEKSEPIECECACSVKLTGTQDIRLLYCTRGLSIDLFELIQALAFSGGFRSLLVVSNGLEDLYLNPHSVLELEQSKSLTGSTAAETPTNQTNQPEPTNQTIKLALRSSPMTMLSDPLKEEEKRRRKAKPRERDKLQAQTT